MRVGGANKKKNQMPVKKAFIGDGGRGMIEKTYKTYMNISSYMKIFITLYSNLKD